METLITGLLVGAICAGTLAYKNLRKALDAYSAEKGKNLAQKEDIEALTRIVEDVKQQNALLLEDHKVKNQLRLAAIDRRLQAHQEAYALWRAIVLHAYGDPKELGRKVMECQEWWNNNCLYLSRTAREAFAQSFLSVSGHQGMVRAQEPSELIQTNWAIVKAAGEAIVSSVELPVLSPDEGPTAAPQ